MSPLGHLCRGGIRSSRWSHQSNVSPAPCLTVEPHTPTSTDPLNWLSAGELTAGLFSGRNHPCLDRATDRDGWGPCHHSPLERIKNTVTLLPLCSREQPFAHDSCQKQMRDKCVVTAANKEMHITISTSPRAWQVYRRHHAVITNRAKNFKKSICHALSPSH